MENNIICKLLEKYTKKGPWRLATPDGWKKDSSIYENENNSKQQIEIDGLSISCIHNIQKYETCDIEKILNKVENRGLFPPEINDLCE